MMLTRSLLRYGLAGLLALTGIAKLLDVPGFVQVLSTYQALPPWALRSVALACGLVELHLAEWLASGKRLPHAALASLVLHSAFTCWSALALLRGIAIPNCGCFGVFWARPLSWLTVGEDLVLVLCSWALYRLGLRSLPPHRAGPVCIESRYAESALKGWGRVTGKMRKSFQG
jgi:methylamine utilization protein MauE